MSNAEKTGAEIRKSFAFYWSFKDAISGMPDADKLATYEAITDFAFLGTEPADMTPIGPLAWKLIRPQLEASIRRYDKCVSNGAKGKEFGKLGGRPPKDKTPEETPEHNPKENPLNHNQNHNENHNENHNLNDNLSSRVREAEEEKRERIFRFFLFEKKLRSAAAETRRFQDVYVDRIASWTREQLEAKLRLWEIKGTAKYIQAPTGFWDMWRTAYEQSLARRLIGDYTAFAELNGVEYIAYNGSYRIQASPRLSRFVRECRGFQELWADGTLRIGLQTA